MSTDWGSTWVPPGADPYGGAASTSRQDTGWDWSWLFPASTPGARPGPPGGGRYGAVYNPERDQPGPDIGKWLQGLFTQSPEDQLTSMILEKMGGGTLTAVAATQTGDPKAIAAQQWRVQTARDTAHRAMNDSAFREQLAQSLGWNMSNPHVAYWVMNGGGVPDAPTSSGLAPGATPAKPTAQQPAAATSTIGAPFDPAAYKGRGSDPGFLYGAVLPPVFAKAAGIDRQWGVDYALPMGTPQLSPFAGTIKEAGFNGPYGYTVVVQMANGYTYRVAHLGAIPQGIYQGATVGVGTMLGPTGSTGNSTGPHVLIEMRDTQGKPIDPTPIIDSLLKGDTKRAQTYVNDYRTTEMGPGFSTPFRTSDGHLIYPGSHDYDVFTAADALWRRRYGSDPPWTFVSSLIAQGATTVEAITSYMDQMASDIPGMKWGARDALTNDANAAAQKAWDRTVPDSTIKDLAAQGITTPVQIQAWIAGHPASSLDKADFKQIYDGANPKTQELWQQPPSPDMVKHIYDQMNKGPVT